MRKKLKTTDVTPRPGEMIKPGEIIGITGIEGWSLSDRRTWNLLLVNAWGDRLEDPTADFYINLREMRGLHDSNDRIRRCLHKLQRTLVTATISNGVTRTVQMLGGTDINESDREEGVLKYDFHRKLIPILRNSEIYARMEVKILSAFSSKYGLALYEVIASKINLHKSTAELNLDTLRLWLGVESNKLSTWGNLLKIAVTPAVNEVNALSPYNVEIKPVKRGRKVVSVEVSWSKKQPFSPAEQAAAREVNRTKTGRKERLSGTVEQVTIELTSDQIEKGYNAAASICRIDKYRAYEDWKNMVTGFEEQPSNPVGHFIEFCKKRAYEGR